MNDKIIMLCSDCKVVKGYRRSAIYDLGRNEFKFIPNSLACIIEYFHKNPFNKLLSTFSKDEQKIINEYLSFLLHNEYIHFCDYDEIELFPELQTNCSFYEQISNSIIALSNHTIKLFNRILTQIIDYGCKHIELRYYGEYLSNNIGVILRTINNTGIRSISLIIPYTATINTEYLKKLIMQNLRIVSIVVYNSPFDFFDKDFLILFSSKNINKLIADKLPTPKSFNINTLLYSESLYYNTFFYQKICIDSKGYWKNSLECSNKYGNVVNTMLHEVLQNEQFKTLWKINKNMIETCKDCEFKYMCVDGRTPVMSGKSWKFMTECPYNPYIAKWKGQEGYITVEQWKKQNPNWEQKSK